MTQAASLQTTNAKPKSSDGSGLLLQRKCACGSNASALTGECAECSLKKLTGQQPPLVQPKLKVSQPNDKYEQEADRVADMVMRMPGPHLQRQLGPEQEEDEETIQTKPIASQITPLLQRQGDSEEEEEELQTKRTSSNAPCVIPAIESGVWSLGQSGGQPLSPSTRAFMEPRFGRDLSNVRIHIGGQASKLAQSLNARAFTIGNDMVFGSGELSPYTTTGQRLIAHELTHVVQQSRSDPGGHIQRRTLTKEERKNDSKELKTAKRLKGILRGWLDRIVKKKIVDLKLTKRNIRRAHWVKLLVDAEESGFIDLSAEETTRLDKLTTEGETPIAIETEDQKDSQVVENNDIPEPEEAAVKPPTEEEESVDPELEKERKALEKRIYAKANEPIKRMRDLDKDVRKRIEAFDKDLLGLLPEKKTNGFRMVEKEKGGGGLGVLITPHPTISATEPIPSVDKADGITLRIVKITHQDFRASGGSFLLTADHAHEVAQRLLPKNSKRSQTDISKDEITQELRNFVIDSVARPLLHELVHAQTVVARHRRGGKRQSEQELVRELETFESMAVKSPELSKSREGFYKVVREYTGEGDSKASEHLKYFVQEKFVGQRVDRDFFGVSATNKIVAEKYVELWVKRNVENEILQVHATKKLIRVVVNVYRDIDDQLASSRAGSKTGEGGRQGSESEAAGSP